MNIEWTIDPNTQQADPEGRLLELTSLANAAGDERMLAAITRHPGGKHFKATMSLSYQVEFDETLQENLRSIATQIENQMTESEIAEVQAEEQKLGNSGHTSKVRSDFFSMVVPQHVLGQLITSVSGAEGGLVEYSAED